MQLHLYRLSEKQLDTLSEISSNMGILTIASVVLPSVLDKFNFMLLVLGVLIAILFWVIALLLKK